MALGSSATRRTTYLNIKDGQIYAHHPNGSTSTHGYVEAVIKSISVKDRKTAAGAPFKDWFVDMADPVTGESYTLTIGYRSGVMTSIILSLASDIERVGERVRIEPYKKGQYTNVLVYLDGVKLDWVTRDLPPVEYQDIGGQRVKNDAARLQFLHDYVNKINQKLSYGIR